MNFFKDLGYPKSNKLILKAYATDATGARDLVVSKMYADIVATQKNLPTELKEASSQGILKGYPVNVIINGTDRGLYMMEPSDEEAMFGMDEGNSDQAAIVGQVNSNEAVEFKDGEAKFDGTDFKSEINDLTQPQKDGFNQLIKFVSQSSDDDFKAHIGDYIDVESVIDHYLFVNWIGGYDNLVKNVEYLTYDGGKTWRMLDQDFDLTLGMAGFGLFVKSATQEFYWGSGREGLLVSENKLVERVAQLFQPEIIARYDELVTNKLIDANKMRQAFAEFMTQPGMYEAYENDRDANPTTFSHNFTSYGQISTFIGERTQAMAQHFADLKAEIAAITQTADAQIFSGHVGVETVKTAVGLN